MHLTLADVPEEILERILALVLVQSAELSPRPSWHPYASSSTPRHPAVISPLLVCRSWLRIATPIHYRHPVLRSPKHAELLLRALRCTPALARCVRSLHLHATSPALRDLVSMCTHLHTLDITVDNADAQPTSPGPVGSATPGAPVQPQGRDRRVVEFCEAFTRTGSVRHLVIRKNAYLTQPNATYVFEQLAKAIARWHKLETVNVAFRLSPSPAASALTQALAQAPRLHTLYTQLPAVWNTTLLDIAQNPALARIVLSPAPEQAGAHLFLAEAKRHPRLVDLIRAGTAPPSPSPYPSPAAAPPQISFSLAGNARARARSTVLGPSRHAPMPVPTWGYESDVPAPACPPAGSSPRPSAYAASPYLHAQSAGIAPYPTAPHAYAYASGQPHAQGAQYHHRQQQQQPHALSPGLLVPGPLGGAQAQKRAAGSRRMTAS
ncbi:hypothetical protein C8Q79DRAFT_926301 [Trametes meyenii]|nr:hypothetical protein C8Q79DRAFT_926301 [Trametes meyenii]